MENKSKKDDPWYVEAIGAVLTFGFAVYTNSELKGLEDGSVASVKMWVPLVWLYEHFGRGATVSVFVILGFIFVGLSVRKLLTST